MQVETQPNEPQLRLLNEEETNLEHNCRLDFEVLAKHRCLTSIVATISNDSRKEETIVAMIAAGMRIGRLNFGHHTHDYHHETINIINRANRLYQRAYGFNSDIAIAVDIRGPQVRTGLIEGHHEFELKPGENFRLSVNKEIMDKGNKESVYVDYQTLVRVVQPGHRVFIDDGEILLIVKEVTVDGVMCVVKRGGMLGSQKNVKLPDIEIDMPPLTEKDRYDLKFALDRKVDMIFVSTVRSGETLKEVRRVLGTKGQNILIIAKIESKQSLKKIDEIIKLSDGILLARADLAIEIPVQKVLLAQKAIIARCNKLGKPVICATNLLKSMRFRPDPTCSEVLDMGNLITDGADCVMLSAETALGKFPVEAVTMATNICREAELAQWNKTLFNDLVSYNPALVDAVNAIAISAVDSARKAAAAAIVVLTTSGHSANLVSRYKPRCPILAVTRCTRTVRQEHIYRGVVPILYAKPLPTEWTESVDHRIQYALQIGKKLGFIRTGDAVVIMSPWKNGTGFTNNLRVLYAFYENDPLDQPLIQDTNIKSQALL